MTNCQDKEEKTPKWREAFDEFHELFAWFLAIVDMVFVYMAVLTPLEGLGVLAISFAVATGFKLRKFKLGKVEVEGGSDANSSDE